MASETLHYELSAPAKAWIQAAPECLTFTIEGNSE
jgi:hypothetical protein